MDFLIKTLYILPGILIALSLHEYAHAQVAVWLGDDTPKIQGRLSISPIVHIDIIGFLMLIIAKFGWAKPVQINPNNFKNPKRDQMLVSLAGPCMNLLLAIFFFILMKVIYYIPEGIISYNLGIAIFEIINNTIIINIVLMVFNMLPIPPLDGHHIFFGLLNLTHTRLYYELYKYSRFILLFLIISDLIDKIIGPPIETIYKTLANFFF